MSKNEKSDIHGDILKDLGVSSEFDNVTTEDLTAEQKRLDIELKKLELEERLETQTKRKNKRLELKREFDAKMRAIAVALAQREMAQRRCNHKKGGLGVEAVINGQGTDENYALLKHQLSDKTWFVQCQRCGAEWRPANRFTGESETVIGGFTYRDALKARTDNSPSKSCVFDLVDNRTPEQIAADRWQPPRDEQGNEIKSTKALPLETEFSEPSVPVRSIR